MRVEPGSCLSRKCRTVRHGHLSRFRVSCFGFRFENVTQPGDSDAPNSTLCVE